MTHIWKIKLDKLNRCLHNNNFPKLRILTDTKGYVVYLNRFFEVGELLLEFCDEDDIVEVYNDIEIVENYFDIRNENKKRGISIAILKDIIKYIPKKIDVFI